MNTVKRAWSALAPKLLAFLATGLTTTGVIAGLQLFGLVIRPELALIIVGGVSSVAAFILRDNLLSLAPGQFSLKVLTFIVTSVSAVTVVSLAGQFGIDLSPYSAAIGLGLTIVATLLGYQRADVTTAKHALS